MSFDGSAFYINNFLIFDYHNNALNNHALSFKLFYSQSQEEFRLWIMDPKHMSEAEKNRTALFPSQVGYYILITKQIKQF